MKFNLLKFPVVIAATATLLSSALNPVFAESTSIPTTDKFEKYRNAIIQDEIAFSQGNTKTLGMKSVDLENRIETLENAEIVELTFNTSGVLVDADSSKDGKVVKRFVHDNISEPIKSDLQKPKVNGLNISPLSTITNPTTVPSGASTGAFHRIQTPASKSLANSYTGVVADSITLPTYDVTAALDTTDGKKTEAAYLYTGIDPSIAEVGLVATRQLTFGMTPGWYPIFHARAAHQVGSGDTNGQDNTKEVYYDSKHRYDNGATISNYKVYYKYDEATLSVRYIIGSQIYQVNFPGTTSTGKSVKRLTTIAMNGVTNNLQKFRVPFQTAAVWSNMRFLYNNGNAVKYPSEIADLDTDTWDHGGKIDYVKSGNVESILIN
ncbi:hypothetical protein J2Z69_001084 [Paenibacillus shirakamiensis]|uniref:Beta-channel forming cytolysin n=1 Tax=Paenibacillus shirakamiensis TaxID=1265935 RepID=A0ABS4JG93_9BACL|nr:hypothetical protein [Paenibacillus shirakamiensis]